jgi:probable phosphoglycerate mutase
MVTIIYLARHGETDWNVERRIQGYGSDHIELNSTGIEQAKKLAEHFKNKKLDVVYSSPAKRAIQTAQIVAKFHRLKVKTDVGLKERKYGQIEGRLWSDVEKKYPHIFEKYKRTRELKGIKGVESIEQARQRFAKTLKNIAQKNSNKKILIISHGTVIRSFVSHLLKKKIADISLENCEYFILEYKNGLFRILGYDHKS